MWKHWVLKVFFYQIRIFLSDQIRSVAQSCPTLCDSMNRSTPGLPVHHQLPEFTQAHVHRVSDAIQPSHSLSSPSPPVTLHANKFHANIYSFSIAHFPLSWHIYAIRVHIYLLWALAQLLLSELFIALFPLHNLLPPLAYFAMQQHGNYSQRC